MLERRLQTQPLDPNLLKGLEKTPSSPLRPLESAPATAPLKAPGSLIDNFAQAPAPRTSELPAQNPMISQALNTKLNPEEAELLLEVSARLATTRQQDPAAFGQILDALGKIGSAADGKVDFSRLSDLQIGLLAEMGMTPQNTGVIFQQLYHMMLPAGQADSSQAFQKVQASVTSFISNLDLRERTVGQIQQQARDLAAVQGVVTSLAANSIQTLLADQTASVYDLAVSRVNSQNFDIRSGMDFTLGHFVVLSQNSPQTLQQVEGLLQKVKSEQSLQPEERSLLNNYGLSINPQNKLQTIDGQVLELDAVNQLENVIYSMKDPSDGYQKVLQASAAVITQSKKLEQVAALAQTQAAEVKVTTQQVQTNTQNLHRIRQDANQLDSQIKIAQSHANHIADAMNSATGLFADVALDPQLLKQWNIQIVAGQNGMQFFMNGQSTSRLAVLQKLGQLLQQQQQEISAKAAELARKKTEALTASATLNQSTTTLETQTAELKQTEQQLVVEKAKLDALKLDYDKVVAEETPNLKPEELQQLETELAPLVDSHVQHADKVLEETQAVVRKTIQAAEQTIFLAHQAQELFEQDLQQWDETLEQAEALVKAIDRKLENLPSNEKELDDIKPTDEEIAAADNAQRTSLAEEDKPTVEVDLKEQQAQLKQKAQQQAQARNEAALLEQQEREKRFAEDMAQSRQTRLQSQQDRERLQREVQELQRD